MAQLRAQAVCNDAGSVTLRQRPCVQHARQGQPSEQQNIQGLYPRGPSFFPTFAHLFGKSQRLKVVTPSLELLLLLLPEVLR